MPHTLTLLSCAPGTPKLASIKAVRRGTGMSLGPAKEAVDRGLKGLPVALESTSDRVDALIGALNTLGWTVQVGGEVHPGRELPPSWVEQHAVARGTIRGQSLSDDGRLRLDLEPLELAPGDQLAVPVDPEFVLTEPILAMEHRAGTLSILVAPPDAEALAFLQSFFAPGREAIFVRGLPTRAPR